MPRFTPPPPPAFGEDLPGDAGCQTTLDFLARRRSTSVKLMGGAGPDPATLDALLRVAMRAPDHRRLFPWRFIVIEGDARKAFGDALGAIYAKAHPDAGADAVAQEAAAPLRAPVIVVLVSSVDPQHKTPTWEQKLSAGAVGLNLLLAANAAGYAANWLTEWPAYSAEVRTLLALGAQERIAGFFYLGDPAETVKERARPEPADKIARWRP